MVDPVTILAIAKIAVTGITSIGDFISKLASEDLITEEEAMEALDDAKQKADIVEAEFDKAQREAEERLALKKQGPEEPEEE